MKHNIKKAAVLGAGTMGAQIAGHLANAGIPCLLFDINQDTAEQGKEVLSSLKPAPLYKPKNVELITACNCLLYTSPSPRDKRQSRMPSSA